MSCPICNQKPMNCDCTPKEREMWLSAEESHQEAESRISALKAERDDARAQLAAAVTERDELREALRELLAIIPIIGVEDFTSDYDRINKAKDSAAALVARHDTGDGSK